MTCKVCGGSDTVPLWEGVLDIGGPWCRCLCCGSDSSELSYNDVRDAYNVNYPSRFGDITPDRLIREQENNVGWLGRFRDLAPSGRFLDIGCCEGSGLLAMKTAGWEVHGFDVMEGVAYPGLSVTVAPSFRADLVPGRYGAVMLREVIEHVEDWKTLLAEVWWALERGGLLQVQTPRPWHTSVGNPYQREHLQLFSPWALRSVLVAHGFSVLGSQLWDHGQLWMTRKTS